MKKVLSLFLIIIICASAAPLSFAAEPYAFVNDTMNMLTESQLGELNVYAKSASEKYGIDIVILLAESTGSESTYLYAMDFYDNGRSHGSYSGDGILLLLNNDLKEWCVYTSGRAETLFSESEEDAIWESYDKPDTYYDGIEAYINFVAGALERKGTQVIPESRQLARLIDRANLLSADEENILLAKLDEISERQKCDVAIVTVDSLDGKSPTAYADDFFDYNGYGYGENDDGILFLISMGERDWAISTYGFAFGAFTDRGQAYIIDKIIDDLSSGLYSSAFTKFADLCDDFLAQAYTGSPFDTGNMPKGKMENPLVNIIISLVIGAGIAFVIVKIMASSLKSVEMQKKADNYVRADSFSLRNQKDTFLYQKMSKTEIPTTSSSSGGGSSSRSSSSGRSHGGSSGKF